MATFLNPEAFFLKELYPLAEELRNRGAGCRDNAHKITRFNGWWNQYMFWIF